MNDLQMRNKKDLNVIDRAISTHLMLVGDVADGFGCPSRLTRPNPIYFF